jgi:hypothetical protein
MGSIEIRLARLERQVTWWRVIGTAAALGFAGLTLQVACGNKATEPRDRIELRSGDHTAVLDANGLKFTSTKGPGGRAPSLTLDLDGVAHDGEKGWVRLHGGELTMRGPDGGQIGFTASKEQIGISLLGEGAKQRAELTLRPQAGAALELAGPLRNAKLSTSGQATRLELRNQTEPLDQNIVLEARDPINKLAATKVRVETTGSGAEPNYAELGVFSQFAHLQLSDAGGRAKRLETGR